MIVGTLEIHVRLDGCFSLKDKRQILRSLVDRARHDFCVSIAEVEDHDLWNSAVIGVACVSNDAVHAGSILDKVIALFDSNSEVEVQQVIRNVDRV